MKLQEMNENDFQVFLSVTKKEESFQRSISLGTPIEQIALKVDEELNRMIPEGIKTPNHFFKTLVDDQDKMIGYLWFGIKNQFGKNRVFIFDIHVFNEYRGKGHGKFMLKLLEQEVKDMGIDEIGLHVLGHNKKAINLYQSIGFEVTNLYMTKRFSEK